MELQGKNALITGSAKRLGRNIALALAHKGVNVAIHYYQSKDDAKSLVKLISSRGLKSIAIELNVEKTKSIAKAVNKASHFLGGLDILVNNVATFYPTPAGDITEKNWDRFFAINLRSQFFFAREFASLVKDRPARIINMADAYGKSPSAKFIPYGVSKAGVIALTKGLAKAYAPNILVNCICPGLILPPDGMDEELQKRAVASTLLKKGGTPEDIAKTVVFLAENDYITGQAIFVDGGRST